jgi:hypothetical protein
MFDCLSRKPNKIRQVQPVEGELLVLHDSIHKEEEEEEEEKKKNEEDDEKKEVRRNYRNVYTSQ